MISRIYEAGHLRTYKYVVVLSTYGSKLMLSRHKQRTTWETQGGHVEPGETPLQAAERELFEESGALRYEIRPLCDYWAGDEITGEGATGMVFYTELGAPRITNRPCEILTFRLSSSMPQSM